LLGLTAAIPSGIG